MQIIEPYIIHHFALETGLQTHTASLKNGGWYYCVFWWYSIPLGDIYIEEYNGNSVELNLAVLNKIEPVIDRQILKMNSAVSYQQTFIAGDFNRFSQIMNALFSEYLHPHLPVDCAISVVICTRQRSKDLKSCLECLQKQIYAPDEIIVVDNAPLDDSTQNVVAQYKNVIYYREKRPGLDIARNAGAKAAKSEIVAYVDDDVQVHPLWSIRYYYKNRHKPPIC